jgi:hypothetical protein
MGDGTCYQPELIPAGLPSPPRKGLVYGDPNLSDRRSSMLTHARSARGPRNGVLTAVEDFVKDNRQTYDFFYFREKNGLGVLLKIDPYRENKVFRKYQIRARVSAIPTEIKNLIKRIMPRTFVRVLVAFLDRKRRS